nr:hypothetical protein GCM10017611_14930 [Rhodococcus wratislaviensis]
MTIESLRKESPTASLHDPLPLPCGQILPNRIMKAALSEELGDKRNAPDGRLEQLYTTWSRGGYGLLVTGNVMPVPYSSSAAW